MSRFDNDATSSMDIGMNIDVVLTEVPLYESFILNSVSTCEDQIVVRTDKPMELLEPVYSERPKSYSDDKRKYTEIYGAMVQLYKITIHYQS